MISKAGSGGRREQNDLFPLPLQCDLEPLMIQLLCRWRSEGALVRSGWTPLLPEIARGEGGAGEGAGWPSEKRKWYFKISMRHQYCLRD